MCSAGAELSVHGDTGMDVVLSTCRAAVWDGMFGSLQRAELTRFVKWKQQMCCDPPAVPLSLCPCPILHYSWFTCHLRDCVCESQGGELCHDVATWVMKPPGAHPGSIHVGVYKVYGTNRSLGPWRCQAQCHTGACSDGSFLFSLIARRLKGDSLCSALTGPHSGIVSSVGSWRQAANLRGWGRQGRSVWMGLVQNGVERKQRKLDASHRCRVFSDFSPVSKYR